MKNKNRKRVLVQAAIIVTALIGLTACGSKSKSSVQDFDRCHGYDYWRHCKKRGQG